ncbi:MAG: V-type ATP synthase subunit D [Thermoplasmatales archaeon B_DKE]|nr:MAG: V-type ATP synthase subunit D [Thermoplasmatales archaeon B_DKE]
MQSLEVRPTRIELIKTNRRIKLAARGLDLLKMKRSALVMEFFTIARQIRGMRENLRKDVEDAIDAFKIAEILDGTMNVERVANMSADSTVSISTKNVMGVKVPEVDINYSKSVLTDRYRAVAVPTGINDAISRYEKIFRLIIEIAEKENSMRKLLYEIDRTKRRSNAIENILIPGLKESAKYIKMRLSEIERDAFTTLKIIKKKMENLEENPQ